MPCDAEVDLTLRRVKARASGIVTYDEIVAARRKFTSDPNFRPDFSQLYDGRDVTRLALTASEIAKLAAEDTFGAASRRAFVAPTRETYALMRLYQTYRQLNAGKEQIKLFSSILEAEAWLAG